MIRDTTARETALAMEAIRLIREDLSNETEIAKKIQFLREKLGDGT